MSPNVNLLDIVIKIRAENLIKKLVLFSTFMARSAVFDMLRQKRSPAKGQRRVVRKDQLLYCRSIYNWGVCLKIPIRQRLFNGKQESWDRITPSNSLKAHGTIFKFVKERVRPEGSFRSVNLISVIFVRPSLRRCHERSLCNKKDAPAKQRGTWRKHSQAPQKIRKQFYRLEKLCEEHGYSYEWMNGQKPHLIKNGIRIQCNTENFVPIVVPGLSSSSSSSFPSSTSMTPSRQESNRPTSSSSSSTSPTTTVLCDSETRDTNEEAQVYVHDLGHFVTVQLVDDTLAVLSLGKLCEEHGYSHEWVSGQQPRLTKKGRNYLQYG